jgi:hypothetical protein
LTGAPTQGVVREYEITDLNNIYARQRRRTVERLAGYAWLMQALTILNRGGRIRAGSAASARSAYFGSRGNFFYNG